MYIHEAVKLALENNCFIKNGKEEAILAIEPTNSPECCILYDISRKNKKPGPRWQPQANDLMCDGWELTERIDN